MTTREHRPRSHPSARRATRSSPDSLRRPRAGLRLRLLRTVGTLAAVVATVTAGVGTSVVTATPAAATGAVGRAVGYAGNGGWIGSYRLANGLLAFCIEAGKPAPPGHDYDEEIIDQLPGHSREDNARLAWLARTYGSSAASTTAAAAQLAIWTITGLEGHPRSWYAARAGAEAGAVLARADAMLTEAEDNATLAVRANLDMIESGPGHAVVATQIVEMGLHGERLAPPHTAPGTLRLQGGRFTETGTTDAAIWNGEPHGVDLDGGAAMVTLAADVVHPVVAGGNKLLVARSQGAQAVLVALPENTAAEAQARGTFISGEAFAPQVVTRTSDTVAAAGTALTDELTVSVRAGAGLLPEWGRYRAADGADRPVPVVVRSRLLGPFASPIEPATDVPADAPEVCRVDTAFDDGPGTATTAPCEVPSVGWYVWVETIDPQDTPAEAGRDRVRAWASGFGVADEVSLAPTVARITTEAGTHATVPGTCVVDHLDVTGLAGLDTELAVRTTLVGPLPSARADDEDLGDLDRLPVAGVVDTVVTADGQVDTDCINVQEDGWYVFVLDSPGSEPDDAGRVVVPALHDHHVHDAETLVVRTPATTTPTPGPTRPAALAFTGSSGALPVVLVAGGVVLVAGALLSGIAVARRRRAARGGAADVDRGTGPDLAEHGI